MIQTKSIFSENFLNAVQTAHTLHAELNRLTQNRLNNHLRDDPWHTLVTYTVSEIERQFWQRD